MQIPRKFKLQEIPHNSSRGQMTPSESPHVQTIQGLCKLIASWKINIKFVMLLSLIISGNRIVAYVLWRHMCKHTVHYCLLGHAIIQLVQRVFQTLYDIKRWSHCSTRRWAITSQSASRRTKWTTRAHNRPVPASVTVSGAVFPMCICHLACSLLSAVSECSVPTPSSPVWGAAGTLPASLCTGEYCTKICFSLICSVCGRHYKKNI